MSSTLSGSEQGARIEALETELTFERAATTEQAKLLQTSKEQISALQSDLDAHKQRLDDARSAADASTTVLRQQLQTTRQRLAGESQRADSAEAEAREQ